MQLPVTLHGLTPREAVADAIHRVLRGYDTNSLELFESGLHPDATFAVGDHVFGSRNEIRDSNFNHVGKMDTTHTLSSLRIDIKPNGTDAQATANALAQHYRTGEGMKPGAPYFLAGAQYELDLVKDSGADGLWRVTRWVLTPVWSQGDASVLHP